MRKEMARLFKTRALLSIAIFLVAQQAALSQEHEHHGDHAMTPEMFAELREKVPLYREFTDEQIMANMARMGPNFQVYLSAAELTGEVGVLALGHGFGENGNRQFQDAFAPVADSHPTAVGLGMAMMTSEHIQTAVDALTGAGARTLIVIPATTVDNGGLVLQWQYIFGQRENAPWMSVPRVKTDAQVILAPTPTTDPLMSVILLDYAREYSEEPKSEVVAIISHGPVGEEENRRELSILEEYAVYLRANSEFAEVRAFTLQDDAPSVVRSDNISALRDWVQKAREDGKRVIVLTNLLVKGSVHAKIERDLEGLDYAFNRKGVMLHPVFGNWIQQVIDESADQG
jgi:hypothetical protein